MRALYAVALVGGFLLLLLWTAKHALGRESLRGERLPQISAASMGFGLGGLSAAYAGWPEVAHVAASIVASVVGVIWARKLGAGAER